MPRKLRVTKRPSYFEAVSWIARNDNAGNGDSRADIEGYISTLLVADLFGADPYLVSVDIARARHKFLSTIAKAKGEVT